MVQKGYINLTWLNIFIFRGMSKICSDFHVFIDFDERKKNTPLISFMLQVKWPIKAQNMFTSLDLILS